jgi:Chitobiase/beta-hexosaminidase C-terminal domain
VKYRELSYLPGTPVSAASGSLDAATFTFRRTRRNWLLVVLALAVMMSGMLIPAYGQGTKVINCPSGFSSTLTAPCGVGFPGSEPPRTFLSPGNAGQFLSGSTLVLQPTGVHHLPACLIFQTAVNVQAFSTTFTFVPDGQTVAFVAQNNTSVNGGSSTNPQNFCSGAGGEEGFYQGENFSGAPVSPNNIFAIDFDSFSPLTNSGSFSFSSTQIYEQNEAPFLPAGCETLACWPTDKISTSPVQLNSPSNAQGTTTGDTYSAHITFTGTTIIENLFDVTAGGSCPGSSCFTFTWNNVSVPAMANGTTAFVGITSSTGLAATAPLDIDSIVYTVLSAAATPTFSPTAGTYGSTQSVTISPSSSSSGSIICYDFVGAPATNGSTGCATGTLYSGAISVPSGRTVYAVAGGTGYGDSAVTSSAYNITGTASMPTFSTDSGIWQGNQNVQLVSASGGVICYNTTGSPATNGTTGCTTGTQYSTPIVVSSNETLYAVAGGTGISDSAVNSVALKISPFAGTAPVNAPSFSPVPGTYAGTQRVTLSSTTPGNNICYTLASSPPSVPPQTDNMGGCQSGTLYSGPISVSSTQTLYAIAGTKLTSNPSSLTAGTYTIGGGSSTPSAPTNVRGTPVPQ